MNINGQTISAQKLDDVNWKFTVEYTAEFAQHEINTPFKDAIKIWEWESDPEALTAYESTLEFFTPTTTSVTRVKTILVDSGTLDTELGSEEIRAQIWLGNQDVPPGSRDEKLTQIIDISP